MFNQLIKFKKKTKLEIINNNYQQNLLIFINYILLIFINKIIDFLLIVINTIY